MANQDDTKKLRKAQQKKVATSDSRQPWQEFLERNQSVASAKAVQAAEVIQGFSGSWASLFNYDPIIKSGEGPGDATLPTPKKQGNYRLGQPGLPEINFPPYDFRTNRGGSRGAALLGHPISLSVVGPTVKSPHTTWQWSIVDNSGSPGVGDTLTLDINLDGSVIPTDIEELYGNNAVLPDGGLYIFISQTGSAGDGEVNTTGGRAAISEVAPYVGLAKFELFRVVAQVGSTFTLDPSKRLATYFTIPATPVVRAITAVEPHVTRLVALPSESGPGKETTFVTVAPETAANNDLYPPFSPDPPTWTGGGFEPTNTPGDPSSYGGKFALPIPVPVQTTDGDDILTGELEPDADSPPNSATGLWRIHNIGTTVSASNVGKLIRVTRASRSGTGAESDEVNAALLRITGWFEISATSAAFGDSIELKRVPEVDPATGEVFFGPGPFQLATAGGAIDVEFTIHDPISSLYTSDAVDLDKLEESRLTNLIDPSWVERTTKTRGLVSGATPARADRAIFDTSSSGAGASGTNANPGSLLDLGFRMVLFPAKDDGGGNPIPDFDRPIASQSAVIDPAATTEQFIDIDYSSGVVCLSHEPATGGDIAPAGVITGGTTNPRGEVVLFAACVPFSQEEGQLGGMRVTGGDIRGADSGNPNAAGQVDAFSRRVSLAVVDGHSITVANPVIDLDAEDTGNLLPPTGFVEVVDDPTDIFAVPSLGTFGYTGKTSYPRTGVQATGHVTTGIISAGDTITIGGVLMTAVAGPRTPGADDFTAGAGSTVASELTAALNDPLNSFTGVVVAEVSLLIPARVLLTAVPIGDLGNSVTLAAVGAGWALSGAALTGGSTLTTATRLTGVYSSTAFPVATTDAQIVLRREPETDFDLDTTYGSASRTSALRFSFASFQQNADGSTTVTPQGAGGPAEELRSPFPLGPQPDGTSDVGRFHLDAATQKWTATSPPFLDPEAHEVGLEVVRGKVSTASSLELDEDDFEFQVFWNRAADILPVTTGPSGSATPPNQFDITIDKGSTSGLLPPGVLSIAPVEEAQDGGLCATVEGATVITSERAQWNAGGGDLSAAGVRFVVNIKDYGDRTDRTNNIEEALNRLTSDEGPTNPVNWVSYTAVGGGADTPATIVAGINSRIGTDLGQFAVPAETDNNTTGRVFLTERQIDILPAKPYFESADVSGGITFPDASFLTLTVYSADPTTATRNRWITLNIEVTKGGTFGPSSDANVIAEFLNDALYGTNAHPDPVDGLLDDAGFYKVDSGTEASPNPDLAGNGSGERQFLFVGPNDPRHPSGGTTVALICGGWGSSTSDTIPNVRDFFNVMLEIHDLGTTNDVRDILGGDFTSQRRCGLFFGDYATEKNEGGFTNPVAGDFPGEATEANANTELGFARNGLRPVTPIGSFPIVNVTDGSDATILRVDLPRGRTPYFSGDQTITSTYRTPGQTLADQEPYRSTALQRSYPYLGRKTETLFSSSALTSVSASSAGLLHIWVGYGLQPFDETRFTSFLTSPVQRGYDSFLIYGATQNNAADPPFVAPGSIAKGDLLLSNIVAGPRSGTEPNFEGIVLNEDAPAFGVGGGSTLSAVNLTAMVLPSRSFSFVADHIQSRVGFQPTSVGGALSPVNGISSTTVYPISIVANPNAVTMSSAVEHMSSNLRGPSTFVASGPGMGAGLDGGSSTALELRGSTMVSSGGRVGLFSPLGPHATAGISFSSAVLGSVDPGSSPDVRFHTTFVEGGVFTSSTSLGTQGFGTGMQDAGVFDAFRASVTDEHGQYGGHQVGGVAGVRISGDAQVWLTNLRLLGTDLSTAVIRRINPTNRLDEGGGSSNTLSGSGHSPQNGAFHPARRSINDIHMEAVVSVALTQSDWVAFQAAVGNIEWPGDGVGDDVFSTTDPGEAAFLMAQTARAGALPMFVPFLKGCYIELGTANFASPGPNDAANEGVWRIAGTPVLTQSVTDDFVNPSTVTPRAFFAHTPLNPTVGDGLNDDTVASGTDVVGHAPPATVVGYLQLRVEKFSRLPDLFFEQQITEEDDGHPWTIYYDESATRPIYVADVVDPGGSPTGSPTSLSGLTINPAAMGTGRGSLSIDLVSVFASTDTTEDFRFTGRGRLLGIHENADSKGRNQSVAYFSMVEAGTPTTDLRPKAYARMVIYSAERADRLDEIALAHTRGEFQRDDAGRVTFVGHPARLSPGVMVDGGLGTVQATAFRSTPRSIVTDTLGALTVWGHGAADPLPNFQRDAVDKPGVDVTSTFNRAEFHDDVTVVSPNSSLVFEDARASHGPLFRLRENVAAAQSWASPAILADHRQDLDAAQSTALTLNPNDALFPYGVPGIRMRTPGSMVYERPFRPLDATGGNVSLSSFRGRPAQGGIKGMEIPAFGEVMLLPKGPPTLKGTGTAQFGLPSSGRTPLDVPLYEFSNGPRGTSHFAPFFPIDPTPVFSTDPTGASAPAGDGRHLGIPGNLSVAYRHSLSQENGLTYGYDSLFSSSFFDVEQQMRLLPGMVIECVDNGTFYTVGDVGRWKTFQDSGSTDANTAFSLGQPGDGTRSSTNGTVSVSGGRHQSGDITVALLPSDGDTVTIDGVVLTARVAPGLATEFAIGGSVSATAANLTPVINANVPRVIAANLPAPGAVVNVIARKIGFRGSADSIVWSTSNVAAFTLSPGATLSTGAAREMEIFYDLNQHTDPLVDPTGTISNGFGDRVDDGDVRRPLSGHQIRITPNVEFVPVLGPRGVDGGLLPPLDNLGNTIEDADAIFYSIGATNYDFKVTDIGRFLYICGTHNYRYTGWWYIIDIFEDKNISEGNSTVQRDVAVLRKWRRDSEGATRDSGTFDAAIPLQNRAPLVRAAADAQWNDASAPSLGDVPLWDAIFGSTSDLTMEVTRADGVSILSEVIPTAEITANSIRDFADLATFANGDIRLNGSNVSLTGGPVAGWIVWTAVTNPMHPKGVSLEVTYNLALLDATQQAEVTGEDATLRIEFLSCTDNLGAGRDHNSQDTALSIGFYSYKGHNSQIDRGAGDRNNAAFISSPAPNNPNSGGNYQAYSAARGIRWVFSAPLLEENVGSFLHLTKPALRRFGVQLASQNDAGFGGTLPNTQAWTSGWPRNGDVETLKTDIYRINRCPNTGHIVLGGDCEIYFPNQATVDGGATILAEKAIIYSPLGPIGNWPDTVTGDLPSTGAANRPPQYALQPIGRERIVTVSPRHARSSVIIGHSSENPSGIGPDGMAKAVSLVDTVGVTDSRESAPLGIAEPWILMDRHRATRSRVGDLRLLANGWFADQFGGANDYGSHTEIHNANSLAPSTFPSTLGDSVYSWSPAGEWWQLYWPKAIRDSWIYDASVPPPTLRIDLSEAFTQAMQPGGGINSPFPGKAPRGARLTRVWVNFGVWGNDVPSRNQDDLPGYNAGGTVNDVLDEFYMCFNLVVEVPGSQVRRTGLFSLIRSQASGTSGLPFGDRAPTASYTHPDNSGDDIWPGGTVVVPLYVNREAGDMMPNVMERFITGGPQARYNSDAGVGLNPSADWVLGDPEYGFGVGSDAINPQDSHFDPGLFSNPPTPVVWGGIDTATAGNDGPFTAPGFSRVLASPHPRSSRVSGGVRSAFTSGFVADGEVFRRAAPDSLSAATMTGITVTHSAQYPGPQSATAGSFRAVAGDPEAYGGRTCSHAFTMALTPVGDFFETPKDGGGNRVAVDPSTPPAQGSQTLATLGRTLETTRPYNKQPEARPFKVGNWLDNILDKYGVASPSGSMLPPGARVWLEVTVGPGPAAKPEPTAGTADDDPSASGCWVGSVKCAFDVETADGTAYTTNVNILGDDGS